MLLIGVCIFNKLNANNIIQWISVNNEWARVTRDNSRGETTKDIISDIIQGFDKGSYEIREDRTDAIRRAIIDAKDGDIVAIIGKGPEKYNIDSRGYHYYNEKEIINEALKERMGNG